MPNGLAERVEVLEEKVASLEHCVRCLIKCSEVHFLQAQERCGNAAAHCMELLPAPPSEG